jgi:hypothetical protein
MPLLHITIREVNPEQTETILDSPPMDAIIHMGTVSCVP